MFNNFFIISEILNKELVFFDRKVLFISFNKKNEDC